MWPAVLVDAKPAPYDLVTARAKIAEDRRWR